MPIVWEMPDGTVRVAVFSEEFLEKNRLEGESTEDAVTRLAPHFQAKVPELMVATQHIIKTRDMPLDKKFRDRWIVKDGKVTEDGPKPR